MLAADREPEGLAGGAGMRVSFFRWYASIQPVAMLLHQPQTWIIKGRRAEDEMYRSMWERAMDDMVARLVVRNNASALTYVASISPCALSCRCQ